MADPTKPVLLLDVMDTLVHDPFAREVPAFFGMSFEELLREKHPSAWIEFELGRIDEDEMVASYFADGRPIDGEGLKRAMRNAYRWLDGIEPLLSRLEDAGYEMHTFSNYPCWYRMIEEKLGISRYAPWTFVSCRTRLRKPDPEAYLAAARELGVAPSRCLFVDDREVNTAAATAAGMDSILFRGTSDLIAELEGRGMVFPASG